LLGADRGAQPARAAERAIRLSEYFIRPSKSRGVYPEQLPFGLTRHCECGEAIQEHQIASSSRWAPRNDGADRSEAAGPKAAIASPKRKTPARRPAFLL
jgi:hypothetical protein